MNESLPCILLYNPVSGHGHLDSWCAIFTETLLLNEHRVLVLTPDSQALIARLQRHHLHPHPNLEVLDWNAPKTVLLRLRGVLRNPFDWWCRYGREYATNPFARQVVRTAPLRKRIKKRLASLLVPPLYAATKMFFDRQYWDERERSESELHHSNPIDAAERIVSALSHAKWRPHLILNLYMDAYKTAASYWESFAAICRVPWTGIRFVPAPASDAEPCFYAEACCGMCFLDEAVTDSYTQQIPGKRFQWLPDITNTDTKQSALYHKIVARAAGRKVVFLGGSIGRQKNLSMWCEIIRRSDPGQWFFVQIGQVHRDALSETDIARFDSMVASSPENVLLIDRYLPDEAEFNDAIKASDVLFAVYRQFKGSSNMLGKSVAFERPIITSDEYLMGERTRLFGIGLTVDENDIDGALQALESLIADPIPAERFASYRAELCEESLAVHLMPFVYQCTNSELIDNASLPFELFDAAAAA